MSLTAAIAMLSAALPQTHAAQSAQDATQTDVVATRADAADRMTVPVRIGANGPYRFMIDTGAENTVVSSEVAQRLALPAGRSAILMGVAGSQRVPTVEIDEIGLGRRTYYTLTAPVVEARHIGADGIIGLDSLQKQRVLIDFRRNLIAIDDARNLGGNAGFEIVVTARRRSGQLIMTDARIDGIKVAVVIDTGAETTIGNRALQRALGRRGRLPPTVLYSVTGQSLPADLAMGEKLQIQDLAIGNVLVAFADSPPFGYLGLEQKPAMLLGMREMRMFPRVAIDFASRQVLFDLPAGANSGGARWSSENRATRIP